MEEFMPLTGGPTTDKVLDLVVQIIIRLLTYN